MNFDSQRTIYLHLTILVQNFFLEIYNRILEDIDLLSFIKERCALNFHSFLHFILKLLYSIQFPRIHHSVSMIPALQMDCNDSIPANGCATRVSVLRRAGAESHLQDQHCEAQEHDFHLEHASNGRTHASVSD